tara:strand:- start:908 stop:1096 length:189 start_codon:yes stop_codon:yes gene_type:complete
MPTKNLNYKKSLKNPKHLEVNFDESRMVIYERENLSLRIASLENQLNKFKIIKAKMDELGVE